jgi:hypothetical protein
MTLDPTLPRDAVVDAGRRRLLTHGIDGLRSQLNASVLAREAAVSRDTAYRAFRTDDRSDGVTDAILAAVAVATSEWGAAAYDDAFELAVDAYQASVLRGDGAAASLLAAVGAAIEAQFRAPGNPAGWALQAAALTASPMWEGDRPDDESAVVAEAILATRREHYRATTDKLLELARITMSTLGRRPRPGVDPRVVVTLTHCLLDGAVLRRFVDPDAATPELVAQAMYLMWLGFSEPGPHEDPRQPEDALAQRDFDRLLDSAAVLWAIRADITVDDVAGHASVALDSAHALFPDVGDLADSLVRSKVLGGGFAQVSQRVDRIDGVDPRHPVLLLVSELERLRDLADQLPHAVAVARSRPPSRSRALVEEMVDNKGKDFAALEITSHPRELVEDLLHFAAQGTPGWPSVAALLRTIGHRLEPRR